MLLGLCWLVIAWLVGAFPTGVVVGTLFADIDITSQGSGNIGATNMNRVLGRGYGVATLVVDMLKGLLPVVLAALVWPEAPTWYAGLLGLLAFAGHCWSPFLDMRGGKGVATSAGVMLGLAPWPTFLAAAVWVGVVLATRKSSLGALVSVVLLPLLTLLFSPAATWVAVLLGLGVVARHKDNLARLRAGTER